MALRMLDATAIVNASANLVQGNSDFCCCFWWQPGLLATAPAYVAPWAITDLAYTDWVGFFGNDATGYLIDANNGSGGATTPAQVLAANQIAHFGYRRFGTTHQFLFNGFIVGTATRDMSAVTFVEMLLGNDRFSDVAPEILIWDYFEWSTSKAVSTIRGQMASYGVAFDVTNLRRATPLLNDLLDDSGNGNDWSGAGNFDFVANPVLPPNVTAATAISISTLPFTASLEAYNLPLWYKRVAQPGESYSPGWGFGGLGSYEPVALIWTGDGTVEWPDASWQTIATNKPYQFPVVPGETFYHEYRSQFGGPGGTLDVSILPEPDDAAPVGGSFLVTDDSPGYGASVISSTDGHVYQFRYPGFPGSNTGEDLPEGNSRILLVSDVVGDDPSLFTNELYLYAADLTPIIQLPRGTDAVNGVTSNKVDTFYLFYNPPGAVEGYVRMLSAAGAFTPGSIGPLTGATGVVNSLAVSPDESILYWQMQGNNLGAIHRWDIPGNAALPDLVASPGAGWFGIGGMISLPTGDVIGGFDQFLSGTQGHLRRYSAVDGSTVWSFDTGALTIDYHGAKLTYGFDWPDSFWLIVHFSNGHSRFINLDSATGATIDSFDAPTFTIGVYDPAESATPEVRYGPAPSCAYIMLRAGIEPPVCPGLLGAPRIGI